MATMGAPNAYRGQQLPLPGSPTLTNPDMILPDYGTSETESDAPAQSPRKLWKNVRVAATGNRHIFALGGPLGQQSLKTPNTPTTPIVYGNGTMLSDIGEVTEVESTSGKPSPVALRNTIRQNISTARGSGRESTMHASPIVVLEAVKERSRNFLAEEERLSNADSGSTIPTRDRDPAMPFADFDDAVSVGDSVFQGDDEDSLASSSVDDEILRQDTTARLGIPNTDSMDRLSAYSSSALSRKAEQILATAKKRLTAMEGNLNRARSSLHSKSSSMSSIVSVDSNLASAKHSEPAAARSPDTATSPSLPSPSPLTSGIAMRNGLPYRVTTQRSASALGAAGGYRQPLAKSRSADHMSKRLGADGEAPSLRWKRSRELFLEPLDENESTLSRKPSDSRSNTSGRFVSPTCATFSDSSQVSGQGQGLRRSASAAQMRGLKDQMTDLKDKISSLREQARTDSLMRRSIQSLRTPSPFTHSRGDQWLGEAEPDKGTSETLAHGTESKSPWTGEKTSVSVTDRAFDLKSPPEDETRIAESENGIQLQSSTDCSPNFEHQSGAASLGNEREGCRHDAGELKDLADKGNGVLEEHDCFQHGTDVEWDSESGGSLYHDAVQHPVSHEDREDAFDYEHFFLHSAMGTISEESLGRNGSHASFASESSIETTRGPTKDDGNIAPVKNRGRHHSDVSVSTIETTRGPTNDDGNMAHVKSRVRQNSDVSVSTVETFATAEEGRASKFDRYTVVGKVDCPLWEETENQAEAPVSGLPSAQVSQASSPSVSPKQQAMKRQTVFGPASVGLGLSGIGRDGGSCFITSIPEEEVDSHGSPNIANTSPPISDLSSSFRCWGSSSATASLHRPSVCSFESTGTTRSFPLLGKVRKTSSTGTATPSSSPDQELTHLSNTHLIETASICEHKSCTPQLDTGSFGHDRKPCLDQDVPQLRTGGQSGGSEAPLAIQSLPEEDQYLIERFVASLGRCVLGLSESGRASLENQMFRRRINAAKRILEGLDPVE